MMFRQMRIAWEIIYVAVKDVMAFYVLSLGIGDILEVCFISFFSLSSEGIAIEWIS